MFNSNFPIKKWGRVLGVLGVVPFMSKCKKAFTGLGFPFVKITSIKLNLPAHWFTLGTC